MIIMAENFLRFAEEDDKILILQGGQIKEFGRYADLIN
jgi:predicted methyltransferase MtxX (methanogen marker protein 4)